MAEQAAIEESKAAVDECSPSSGESDQSDQSCVVGENNMPRNMQMRQIRSIGAKWTQEGKIIRQTNTYKWATVTLLGSVDVRKRNQATLIGIRVIKQSENGLAFGFGKDYDNKVYVSSYDGNVDKYKDGNPTGVGKLGRKIG